MSTLDPQVTPAERHPVFAISTVIILIFAPVIGLIMLAQRELTWKAPAKVIVAILTVLYLPVHAIIALTILYAGGSINPLLPNDTIAKHYLQERYHEEFVILRNTGSDQLGGSINYSKWVSPKNDPDIEFTIGKCLARCKPYESTEFIDTYPQKRWSRDLTETYKDALSLTEKQSIVVYANSGKSAGIVDANGGVIPNLYQLTAAQRNTIGASIYFNEQSGEYSMATRPMHAARILAIVKLAREAGVGSASITYDVKTDYPTTASKFSKDTFHFTTNKALTLTATEDIYPLFTAQTSGRGLIKEAYTLHQTQVNISKRQTMGTEGKPSPQQASKAALELEIAERVKARITSRYILPPYVIATILPNETPDSATLYSDIDPSAYSVVIAIYNYPNETVPITNQGHQAHAEAVRTVIKDLLVNASLVYKSDTQTCEASGITTTTTPAVTCRLEENTP